MIEFFKSIFYRIKLEINYRRKKKNTEQEDPYLYK